MILPFPPLFLFLLLLLLLLFLPLLLPLLLLLLPPCAGGLGNLGSAVLSATANHTNKIDPIMQAYLGMQYSGEVSLHSLLE